MVVFEIRALLFGVFVWDRDCWKLADFGTGPYKGPMDWVQRWLGRALGGFVVGAYWGLLGPLFGAYDGPLGSILGSF